MNTITGIEAERVNQILKHALDRLHIMAYVPMYWDDDLLSEMKTQAVINSLEKQWLIEEQLRAIGDNAAADKDSANGKDLSVVGTAHRAAKTVCRNLQADRDSLQVLIEKDRESKSRPESQPQSDSFSKFMKYLNELRSQVLTRMMTTVEDEAANRHLLHELTERERHLEESRETLQKKLDEVREEKDRVTFGLDQTIRKLQLEIQDITQRNRFDIDGINKDMNESIAKIIADHELRMRQLQDLVDGLERQCVEMSEKNKDDEQRLRKEKTRAENSLNSKISIYDDDMASKKTECGTLKERFLAESKEYAELKEYFDKVDADLGRNAVEERILSDVKKRRAFGVYAVGLNAITIQKIVRGRQARQLVAKMKKPGKGKGKKK